MQVEKGGEDRDDASEVPGRVVSTVPHSTQLTHTDESANAVKKRCKPSSVSTLICHP